MAKTPQPEDDPPKKAGKLPLIAGIVLALLGGGGGFFAVSSGLLGGGNSATQENDEAGETGDHKDALAMPDIAFVPLEPVVVSLGPDSAARYLRFAATLEVPSSARSEVEHLLPRVTDALNSFLQALQESDVASRDALLRLRVQMLHRVRLVVGEDRVRDLLVAEFVLN